MTTPKPREPFGGAQDDSDAFEEELAAKTYEWLDQQFADRDQKDVETLEVAALTYVGSM